MLMIVMEDVIVLNVIIVLMDVVDVYIFFKYCIYNKFILVIYIVIFFF